MKPARFLVLRGGAIGDFILTLPALRALRERWPDAYIELVGYPHIANLALAGGIVDHVDSLERVELARFFSWQPSFTEDQIRWIRSFDLVLTYLHDPDGLVQNNLALAGAKQVIYGPPVVERGPAVRHLLKPLETLALYPEVAAPRLILSEGAARRGAAWIEERGWGGGRLALHPGSGSPQKNWPLENFLSLAEGLRSTGIETVFITGEADAEIRRALARECSGAPVIEGLTLVELASVLLACGGFVGNDSGITHLAAALGLPVVAIFGPTDPDVWGPAGDCVTIFRAPGGDLARLAVDDVLNFSKPWKNRPNFFQTLEKYPKNFPNLGKNG